MVNTQYLEEAIANSGKKKQFLAEKCGLSRFGFYQRINNQAEFTAGQIKVLCSELGITSLKRKEDIFFA